MSAAEPLEIECPKCRQLYRFAARVPPQLACKRCKTVMDLRAYATVSPQSLADGGPAAAGRSTTNVDRRDRPRRSASKPKQDWRGIVLVLIVSGGVFRLWQRSRDEDAAQAEKQRALDELLDPSHFTRKLRDAEFQKGIDDALKRIPLPDALRTGPEVHLASPTEGEVLTASPAHVEGEFVLAKPTDVLSVNGAAARTGSGKFSVDVALTPGENTIEIAVTWGVHVDRASIHVKYSPPR